MRSEKYLKDKYRTIKLSHYEIAIIEECLNFAIDTIDKDDGNEFWFSIQNLKDTLSMFKQNENDKDN